MHFSVGLQNPFDYALKFFVIALVLILLSIILLIVYLKLTKKDFSTVAKKFRHLLLGKTRRKYLRKIDDVERYVVNGKKDSKTAHQEMSLIVRQFVHAATGVHVDRLVYTEIKRLKIKPLSELVRDFYEPEFAEYSEADMLQAIKKSKELIKTWK